MQAGLSKEQTDNFIATNFLGGKTADQHLNDVYDYILTSANLEKNEKTAAYVEGFLTSAVESGAPFADAVEITKQALAKAFPQQQKQAQVNPEMQAYFNGFIGFAKEAGFSLEQTTDLLKFAAEAPGVDPAMLEQIMQLLQAQHGGQGAGPGPEAAEAMAGGMGGGMGGAGGGAEELKAALMQAIMSGQGGGAGGPPMPPQGGGSELFKQMPQGGAGPALPQ